MLNRKREIAKFFSGFEAFHTIFHGYLLVTAQKSPYLESQPLEGGI